MISIKPLAPLHYDCPVCGSGETVITKIHFPGIRVLADVGCKICQAQFIADIPVGHAMYYPKMLEKNTGKIYPSAINTRWFERLLSDLYASKSHTSDIHITKRIYQTVKYPVLILNCLDYLYGHVLLKLFNTSFHLETPFRYDVIVLIPASFEWLLPAGISEAWLVKGGLGSFKKWQHKIDSFVHDEISRYEKVFLAPGYSHPDLSRLKIEVYTKTAPFDLSGFENTPPTITFIYREDRLWHGSNLEEKVFLILQNFKWGKNFNFLFLGCQKRRIVKFFKAIKKSEDKINCVLVGLGKRGVYPEFISDVRSSKITAETETDWCSTYSRSHVVVGVHGSNMLLPTAHAAAFVEILPDTRIGNITQDVFCRYHDRMMIFMGRFVSYTTSCKTVAKQALSIIKNYSVFKLNNDPAYLDYSENDLHLQYSRKYSDFMKKWEKR